MLINLLNYFLDLPAFLMAIAIAFFCGLPACISLRMFSDITFFDVPFFSGITHLRLFKP